MSKKIERVAKRTREAMQSYRAVKSVSRGAEAPAVVTLLAAVLYMAGRSIDADLPAEYAMGAAIAVYGVWRGVRNWWKNRDR